MGAASANSLNMVVDYDIDQVMKRTERRPLARHAITRRAALIFGLVLGGASMLWLGLLANSWLAAFFILITILSVIWDFNVFNQIWLVTEGGPDNTTATLGVWTLKPAFVSFKIGAGAAISVVTTLLLLIITGCYIRRLLRSGEDL